MLNRIIPNLVEISGSRRLSRPFPFGLSSFRVRYRIFWHPRCGSGIHVAAELARRLKIGQVSLVEHGVAGRRGLRPLEAIAEKVSRAFKIRVSVYGFDTGNGMPASIDDRRLPHVWVRAFTGRTKLRLATPLKHAQLILGDVVGTICPY